MITEVEDFEPATVGTAAELEQDLLFVAQHSSTGIVRVQFIQDGKMVAVELRNHILRTAVLSGLIDGIGNAMELAQKEEAQA